MIGVFLHDMDVFNSACVVVMSVRCRVKCILLGWASSVKLRLVLPGCKVAQCANYQFQLSLNPPEVGYWMNTAGVIDLEFFFTLPI